MSLSLAFSPLRSLVLVVTVLVAGCATPVFKDVANRIDATPLDVQRAPERYTEGEVVWAGRIIAVENRETTTEVELVGYPMDRAQRPLPEARSEGRFILVLPGYVEAYDYPEGRYVTVHGRLAGSRVKPIQQRDYVFPLVRAQAVHVWPSGFQFDKPTISLGIGVGIH
ncbi:Slp family lipoprotein [Dokdonella koreensis]|uniref:Slp family lipoprotein n=1 Tax=Dokdonella koreensis TaxID=323415 RepID=UPI00082BFA68|nr:Slp family lipoprotein [Dokdonella koreensis]